MTYPYAADNVHPIKGAGTITTEKMAAALVIGALIFLILVRRGFAGINVRGLGGVNIGK